MRENCLSGSEGGGPDRPVRPPYPYQAPDVTPAKAGVQAPDVTPAKAGVQAPDVTPAKAGVQAAKQIS